MHTVFNTLIATFISVLGGMSGQSAEPTEVPAVIAVNASDQQQAQLEQAIESFDAAGLDLPPLVVEFAPVDDTTPCHGNAGLFFHGTDTTPDTVVICHKAPIFLLHELAHAYVHENLDASARAGYLEHLGLSEWNDQSAKWADRANERAANTIAYTLTLEAPTKVDKINALVCDFEVLTNTTHANVTNANCEATA